jgi:hypothetical protein
LKIVLDRLTMAYKRKVEVNKRVTMEKIYYKAEYQWFFLCRIIQRGALKRTMRTYSQT